MSESERRPPIENPDRNRFSPEKGKIYRVIFPGEKMKANRNSRVKVKIVEGASTAFFTVIADNWKPLPNLEYRVALENRISGNTVRYYGQWTCVPVDFPLWGSSPRL